MADDKTYRELALHYWWPSMRADTRRAYRACSFCELSKAKRNLTHKKFRAVKGSAPRSRWGMDFYGVGDSYVLGMIDLDSLWVELAWMETREADNVTAAIRDRILFRHGVPSVIHSDHAAEFVGRSMTKLAADFGFTNTTTGGYCATGNSTIERFWAYFGVCIRALDDEAYQDADTHVQHMAWAWNTTHHSSIDCRPFSIMTGCLPRTIAGSVLTTEPPSEPPCVASVRTAAKEYHRAASAHGDYMREKRAETLNKHGRSLRSLQVGDFVKIFMPPGHDEALRRQRKAKHIVQFRGPLRVDEKLSTSTFLLSCYFNPERKFKRHLTNIRRWVGPLPSRDENANGVPPASHDAVAVSAISSSSADLTLLRTQAD